MRESMRIKCFIVSTFGVLPAEHSISTEKCLNLPMTTPLILFILYITMFLNTTHLANIAVSIVNFTLLFIDRWWVGKYN